MQLLVSSSFADLERSAMGMIAGKIWIERDGLGFPEENWWDDPAIILNWWISAIDRLLNGLSNTADLDFMEGQFSASLSRRGTEFEVMFYEYGKMAECHDSIQMSGFLASIQASAKSLIETCDDRGWSVGDEDISTLRKRVVHFG